MAPLPVHCGAPASCCTTSYRPGRSAFSPYKGWSRQRRSSCVAVLQQEDPTERSAQLQGMRQYFENLYFSGVEQYPAAVRVLPVEDTDPSTVWHFAYGANMNFETLSKRGVKVISRDPAMVVDPEVKMVFKHRGGYATLHKQDKPGKFPGYRTHVHGVLFKVSMEDMKKLCTREGGYALQDMEVDTYDGRRVTAKVFVSGPMSTLAEEVKPTERYMRLLRAGAGDNYLDPLYQAWLSSVETVPSAGLGHEYYDTPAKYVAYSFLGIVGLLIAGFFAQHA